MNNNLTRNVQTLSGLNFNRSTFDLSFPLLTSFESGKLVPICVQEVLPGDTFKVSMNYVLRELSPVVPVMDNSFIDIFSFYVPNRIIAPFNGDDWEAILGVNKDSYWAPTTEKSVTTFTVNPCSVEPGSLLDYIGFPACKKLVSNDSTAFYNDINGINLYPCIAYCMIWDNYFRDENTQTPICTQKTHSFYTAMASDDWSVPLPYNVNKFHDYFTSCLPSPQKGASVMLPLGDKAPLFTEPSSNYKGMKLYDHTNGTIGNTLVAANGNVQYNPGSEQKLGTLGFPGRENTDLGNTFADLSAATAASINQLRMSFAIQRLLERDARCGTRYNEYLKGHFGVTAPAGLIDIPEYLGGFRQAVNVTQVLQTSQTSAESPLGNTGAFSNTSSFDNFLFEKSFVEHGFIIVLACVRTNQTYFQGIPKYLSRSKRFDYYHNEFAFIGEQPVYKWQLVANANSLPSSKDIGDENAPVFGYQEAWADYRERYGVINGILSPNSTSTSFEPWSYALPLQYNQEPVLNEDFLAQSSKNIAKTLVNTKSTIDQFILNARFNIIATRELPVVSIPGLIDHM